MGLRPAEALHPGVLGGASRTAFTVVAAVAVTALATAILLASLALSGAIPAGAVAPDDPFPPVSTPATVNEFLPEDRDLSDCLSVLPKPGCGSQARGGPQQAAVLGAILGGLAIIGGRIAWSVRRSNVGSRR